MINDTIKQLKNKITELSDWLSKEYAGIRTGRATPAIVDSVMVESYGSKTPLKHVAAINIEDAKTLRIVPWDTSLTRAIESGIDAANIGVKAIADGNGLRLSFPDLTEERRKMLLKLTNEKLEEARISLRKERERLLGLVNDAEKKGEISEDDKFKGRDELQKAVNEGNATLEAMAKKKETEILS